MTTIILSENQDLKFPKEKPEEFPEGSKSEFFKDFPAANFSDIRSMALGDDKFLLPYKENDIPDFCHKYGCEIFFHMQFFNDNGIYVMNNDRCISPDIDKNCVSLNMIGIRYNCIGYGLGIRDIINPSIFRFSLVGDKFQPTKMNEAIKKVAKRYLDSQNEYHHKNILNIVQHLEVPKHGCNKEIMTHIVTKLPDDNMVVFFQKNHKITHAARYIKEYNLWTSKMGASNVITHKLSDLTDSNNESKYGVLACFAYVTLSGEWVSHLNKDEL